MLAFVSISIYEWGKWFMENASKLSDNNKNKELMTLTANELANALGENYKSVQKMLNILATSGEIEVSEKVVNNRTLKGYKVSIDDIQRIKLRFNPKKHLQNQENPIKLQMLENGNYNANTAEKLEENTNGINVKFYEVVQKNAELTKEVEKLRKDIQEKTNTNVRLDADLTVAKSELKFIEDKSKTYENSYNEKRLEVEKLNKVVKSRNIALIALGAVFLVFLTVVLTVMLVR